MTNTNMSKSLISALQNRGGYCRHTVIDNPSDRTYRALSWLFAATSAFVCIAQYLWHAPYMPLTSIGTSSEPHRDLIGTSPKDYREILKGYIEDILGM